MNTNISISTLSLLLSPKKGWGRVAENKSDKEVILSRVLFPLMGVASLVVFFKNLHFTGQRADSNLETAIIEAATVFIQFFITYYLTSYTTQRLLEKKTNKCVTTIYTSYVLATAIIFYIISFLFSNYVSYIIPILSMYTVYVAWCGCRYYLYLNKSAETNRVAVIVSIMTLLLPAVFSILIKIIILR